MPKFGASSKKRLATCHPDIQLVMNLAIQEAPDDLDFSIVCGRRSKEAQNKAFNEGNSHLKWPHGKHNVDPDNPRDEEYPDKAHAVDAVPWPELYEHMGKFRRLADHIKAIAKREGIDLHWGWDLWNWDPAHWQIGK